MFDVRKQDPTSRARLGILHTPHGDVHTPAYVIVGTHGLIRCLEPEDIPETKTQMIIANTYHLWRSLGEEGLHDYEGLHASFGWNGPIMTDSGGFQVFSLGALRESGRRHTRGMNNGIAAARTASDLLVTKENALVRITPSGVYFRQDPEAAEEYLDAELSLRIQEQLGADIVVAFDEPTSPLHDRSYTEESMQRTHAWALRSLEAKQSEQLLYGVVQGGAYEDLRTKSAQYIGSLGFDGIAIGGTYSEAYGGTREETRNMLRWSIPHLPAGIPRHLFGVGRIEDLFLGVGEGIDTFDCVIPTREARHGRLWTTEGPLDIQRGAFARDTNAIDPTCGCPVCLDEAIPRHELHLLFKSKNLRAGRFATMHNIYFFNNLMEEIRKALESGQFEQFKREYLKKLGVDKPV